MSGKKWLQRGKMLILLATVVCFSAVLCSGSVMAADKNTPRLYMGYIFTTHHTPLMLAAVKGEAFKKAGAYFKEMVPKQKYELISKDGKSLAVINLIVSKSGSETTTLFAQERLDLGLASSTAFMSGIDKGTKIKILSPLHVDGMSMVFPQGSTIQGWDDVKALIEKSKTPLKIGYHSPTSAPRIAFEGALSNMGYKITQNANDVNTDILLVDLKSTSNLIPALVSKQVDCWVGPAPHPVVAEYKHVGHIGMDSRELPPAGQWEDFPCCVMGASDKLIASNPEVIQSITDLMAFACTWANANKLETAKISSKWIGVPVEAVEKSSIVYTTDPSEKWLKGEGMFLTMLQNMNKLKGTLKNASVTEASPLLFDFSFIKKTQAEN